MDDDRVMRIDITFCPADRQAMVDDLDDLMSSSGGGGGGPGGGFERANIKRDPPNSSTEVSWGVADSIDPASTPERSKRSNAGS